MKQLESAGIVVYRMHDKAIEYLLLHYYPAGHWDLPKGNIERGETRKQAALRELQEETGLMVQLQDDFLETVSYYGAYEEPFFKTVYFFVGKSDSDEVTLSDEHQNYAWLPYEQALEKVTYDSTRNILQKAHQFIVQLS